MGNTLPTYVIVWTQPTRDDVTMKRHLSLTEPIHRQDTVHPMNHVHVLCIVMFCYALVSEPSKFHCPMVCCSFLCNLSKTSQTILRLFHDQTSMTSTLLKAMAPKFGVHFLSHINLFIIIHDLKTIMKSWDGPKCR